MVPRNAMRTKTWLFVGRLFLFNLAKTEVAPRLALEANDNTSLKPQQYGVYRP